MTGSELAESNTSLWRLGSLLWKLLLLLFVVYTVICILLVPAIQLGLPIPQQNDGSRNEVLANFYGCEQAESAPESCAATNGSFFFGLASSAGQVEDKLNDSWLELAKGSSGKVRAWKGMAFAEERLRFWSEPDVDLRLAGESGAKVFRLSVDWGRIVTAEPVDGKDNVDWEAVEHYRHIFRRVHAHGMRVMLTLFHFALPKWVISFGGWTDPRAATFFASFTKLAKTHFGEYVDYWVTFNEPNVFVILTHCTGSFPPGAQRSLISPALCVAPFGAYGKAMSTINKAHREAYGILHEGNTSAPVGVAHFAAVVRPYGILETPAAIVLRYALGYPWIDQIQDSLDFCGINYYGREVLSLAGLMIDEDEEYSEAGRGVYPGGLFEVLTSFHQRYRQRRPGLRFVVTENGIGDSRDLLRRPFIIEHLLAVSAAREQGVPVDGYIHWTISDNWEWIDGYCPKFGLVSVNRADNLSRSPRPSYYLYQQLSRTGVITQQQRRDEWETLQNARRRGGLRPFCRFYDSLNIAGVESRDSPILRPFVEKDWRLGLDSSPSYLEYCWRSVRLVSSLVARCVTRIIAANSKVSSEHTDL